MAKTNKKTIPLTNFALTSEWTSSGGKITDGPTRDSKTFNTQFSLNFGAKIVSIKFYATPTSKDFKGTLTVNGSGKRSNSGNAIVFDLGKKILNDTVSIELVASGDKTSSGSLTLAFSNVHVDVQYKNDPGKVAENSSSGKLTPPPRGIYIYDNSSGKKNKAKLYVFDGVTQIQHNCTVSIEENPDKSKSKDKDGQVKDTYINNAKNEPDKLVVDVVMSDIYGGSSKYNVTSKKMKKTDQGQAYAKASKLGSGEGTAITTGLASRSSNMLRMMIALKESRAAVVVITPQNIYTKMLVTGVSATQNPDHPFGWEGQITFQGNAYIKVANNTKKGGKTTVQVPSASALVQIGIAM